MIGRGVSKESVYNNSKVKWSERMPPGLVYSLITREVQYGRLNTNNMETFPDGTTVIEVRWYSEEDKYLCKFRHRISLNTSHLLHLDNGFFDFFDVEEICNNLDLLAKSLKT